MLNVRQFFASNIVLSTVDSMINDQFLSPRSSLSNVK